MQFVCLLLWGASSEIGHGPAFAEPPLASFFLAPWVRWITIDLNTTPSFPPCLWEHSLMSRRVWLSCSAFLLFFLLPLRLAGETPSQAIDRLIAAARVQAKATPAPLSDDGEFLRRLYLDLIGRIPTREELQRFVNDRASDKRAKVIDTMLAGGEFATHWRENLKAHLTGSPAFTGNSEWRAWLETALQKNRKWDDLARTILLARADKPEDAGAAPFLVSRLAQGPSGLDLVTRDVSRLFFGVDIQCARCHKHPEVNQWKQVSYWGMAAYFNRSYLIPIKGKMYVAEKATGEVTYPFKGKVIPARPRFLTGETLAEPALPAEPMPKPGPGKPAQPGKPQAAAAEDPALYRVAPEAGMVKTRVPVPKFSRREKFVELAVSGKNPFFKRAIINYVWAQFLGRGLVEPLDQMHDGNPPSHPELLRFLADDFVTHEFDLRHLVRTIANSQTYQLSSRHPAKGKQRPAEETYSYSLVRPLSAHQLANSLMMAAGYYETLKAAADVRTRSDPALLRTRFEAQNLNTLVSLARNLDNGSEPFQPGIREALFQANSPEFAQLITRGGLAGRLAKMKDDANLIQEVYLSILSRQPTKEEVERCRSYLQARITRRAAACEQLVWALVSCSEFRFNH